MPGGPWLRIFTGRVDSLPPETRSFACVIYLPQGGVVMGEGVVKLS